MRYFLEIGYKGANYSGWQVQRHGITVQGILNHALTEILRTPTSCTGASRTDTGVHAKQNFAQFECSNELASNFLKRLNRVLPDDVVVKRVVHVSNDRHVRHDARLRSYEYHIHFIKDPMLSGVSYFCPYPELDLPLMKRVAALLPQFTDFSVLSKRDKERGTICQIKQSRWVVNKSTGQWVYHISADRFLWGMVRRIVGLMIMVGHHRISAGEFETCMQTKQPLRVNYKAPAEGLYLTAVRYKKPL